MKLFLFNMSKNKALILLSIVGIPLLNETSKKLVSVKPPSY